MRPPPKFRPDAFASVPATAVAVVIFAAIVPGFSVAEECGRAYAGMHDAHLAVVQGVGEVRNFEISTKFSKYGKRNALLGGGLETCGFNVKTALGANRYLIRGASTERGWDRIPSEFDYPSQGSVVEAQVATPDGARVPWLAGITFVRRANPGEEIGVGVGLKLKARLLDDWVSMQSNLAWAGVEGGLESLVGLAQRHQLAARMLDRNQHSIGLRTTLQFERVEPDYGGPTANRDPDRQSTEVGTELSLDGASLKVSRSFKFDNVTGENGSTNRWDQWKIAGKVNLGKLGLSGMKLGVTWQRGAAYLDEGDGFDHQNNSETVKVKLRLSKNFATAFVNERQFDLHSDDGPRTDTANALAFSWKRAFGAIKLQHRVKVSYVEQESEPDTGVDMSYEFKARSRYQDNLYWKLGVEMGRRETENDRFRLFSSIYVRL
jgi:hypothetical protein